MKKVFSLALVAVMAFALVACGGGGSNDDTIRIGGLAPLTGAVAQYGTAANNGALLAVKEINEAGGVLGKQVEYICYDEKGDPTEALNAYAKLVQNDKVVALVGDVTTKPTIAVAQKAVEDNLPMITPTGTGAEITEIGANIFRACFTDPYQGRLLAHFAQDELGATTAAILYDTGDDYSIGVADAFEAEAKALGITIVAREGYTTGTSDFNAQLTSIKAGSPDVIMAPCYYEDAAKITVQARNLEISSTFLGPDGWDGVLNQLDASNHSALNGSYYCSQYPLNSPTEALQKVMDDYKAAYGEDVNMFGVLGYEAMHIMCAAINQAGSTDSDAIVKAIQEMEYEGVMGSISYANGNDPQRDAYIIEFVDGTESVWGGFSFE